LLAIQSTAKWYSEFLAGKNAYTITIREIEEYLEKL